ncbi:hypothetical protein D9757_004676 [Collybiopsis confluens]|uniref:2-dehydropantoate 2-reductase n=1 Tax=Collybiopsis confluens TaxID=2823264 RepID=A0A8H5MC48_9AGAR|nr:hypothetical protein D9757_004676 [Collybiopsis confluens]
MRFHVVGLGAVGTLVAHHLRRSLPEPHSVSLIHKTVLRARQALWKNGVSYEESGIPIIARPFTHGTADVDIVSPTSTIPNTSSENRYIESLFVTLKAQQTLPAMRQLANRLSPNSTIVLLQNGMGVYDELMRDIFINPKQRPHFIIASNSHGTFSRGLLEVVHTGQGTIQYGIIPDVGGRDFEAGFHNTEEGQGLFSDITTSEEEDPFFSRYRSLRLTLASLQAMEALNTSWLPMSDMQIAIRRKLVVNAAVNPLTALIGCKNGEVFQSEASRALLRKICTEASDVFKAEMLMEAKEYIKTADIQSGQDVLLDRLPEALTRQSLEEECLRLAQATKHNISSMLADIRARKGSGTEIDYINGYLLKLGKAYNVYLPVNATLTRLVKMKSTSFGQDILL